MVDRQWFARRDGERGRRSSSGPALAAVLGYPLLAKDTIKDALVSKLGARDVEASRRLGGAAMAAVLAAARDCRVAVLESVWHRTVAASELAALGAPLVEVFCRCERSVARARNEARAGTRAFGHFDQDRLPDELWNTENAAPVAGGWPVLEVDTSSPVEVVALTAEVRDALAEPARAIVVRDASPSDVQALAAVHLETVTTAYAGIFPPDAPVPSLSGLTAQWGGALAEPNAEVLPACSPLLVGGGPRVAASRRGIGAAA